MACDEEDGGFQMLNDDEIVTSVQEEYDPVDDETDEDEDNNDSSKSPSNADALSALETAMEWYEQQSAVLLNNYCSRESETLQQKKRRCTMVQRKKVIIFHNKGKIATFCTYFAFSSGGFPACDFQYSSSVRFYILQGSHSVSDYPKNRVSERCPLPIDSNKRRSTVI
ncbi:hypothetical protein TNCV_1144871 [Trichonephila clavipes]|nr:hypothetical protein TNCV_1144871 [Trichonephila clavipes]